MKKIGTLWVIAMVVVFAGCKKSAPTGQSTQPTQTTVAKTVEAVKPIAQEAKQALVTAAANVDLTTAIDKLKEQAKQMSLDALKETAQKYKEQFLATKTDLQAKMESFSTIQIAGKLSTDAQALTKDIQTSTDTLAAIRDRLDVYVEALKAQGIDVSQFTTE